LQVLVVALAQRLGRVVVRHDEHAVADRLHPVAHVRLLYEFAGFYPSPRVRAKERSIAPEPLPRAGPRPAPTRSSTWRRRESTASPPTARPWAGRGRSGRSSRTGRSAAAAWSASSS